MTSGAKEPRARIVAAFAALYIVWGSTYLAIRYAVETIPPFLLGGGRFVISGAILYLWTRRSGRTRPTRAQWKGAAVAGLLMLVGGNGAVVWSEQHVASGLVALIVAIVPLWMVLLDWLRPGGVRPRVPVFVGLALGLAGLGLLIGPDALRVNESAALDVGAALVPIVGSMLWAAGSIYSRQAARPSSAPLATGMQMLAGGTGFLILAAAAGELGSFHIGAVSRNSALGFGFLVTFGSLVGFTAYIYLLRVTTAAKAATYAYVNPVVAVLLGWAIAGEAITARILVAAAVILGGVAIITLTPSAPLASDAAHESADAAIDASGDGAGTSADPAGADDALSSGGARHLLDTPDVVPHEPQSRVG